MRFSILMPSMNGLRFLEAAVQSVLSQTGDFELRVLDGGSTDGSRKFLEKCSDARIVWKSKPDGGQGAALNEGLREAQGEIIGWLNCDDLYCPEALATVAKAFETHPHRNWIAGRCDIIDDSGQEIRQKVTAYKNQRLEGVNFRSLLQMNVISQPAVFWRRDFGREVGELDEKLHWTMDYDFWLRMALRESPFLIRQTLARFRVHGASKSAGGHGEQFAEGLTVAKKHGADDPASLWLHRWNVQKIVWGYRLMRWMGQ